MTLADFCEGDDVLVTGNASSPSKRYVELRGVIATLSESAVKIWPTPEIDGGKIWFQLNGIESMVLIQRDE